MNSQSNIDQKRTSPPTIDSSPLTMDKNRESLKIKLMVRRSANQLVQQGILPDLKTSPAIHEQRQKLERAKTGDLLKAKIQQRPNREELERRHILESHESHIDPSLADKYRMLEKAILVDQLNSKISHRPGPLELIEKNILHANEPIERIVKEHLVEYKLLSVDESVIFEDDSQSSEGDAQPKNALLTTPNIEQPTSSLASSTAILNGNVIKLNLAMPCTIPIPIPKLTIKLPSNETTSIGHNLPESFITTNPPPPPPLIINTKLKEMPSLELIKPTSFLPETKITIINNNNNNNSNIKSHISSFIQNNQKLGGKDKNRKKCKIKPSMKSKAIKFHEYKGPPNANKSNSLASLQASLNNKKVGENNYSLIMQQQCLLEYLEGIYKNPNSQKNDSDAVNSELQQVGFAGDKVNLLKHPDSDVKKEDSKKAFVIFPSKAPLSTASNSSTQVKDALISDVNQLSKLKVSELKAFLKRFSLPVSGQKPLLVERLKPFLPLKMGDHQHGHSDGLFEDKKEVKSMFDLKESPMQSPSAMLIGAENSFEGSNASSNTVGEDIVKEQQRKIEELQRKLQESQHELEQIKQIKHSDSFSSLSGVNTKSNAIDEEPFFQIIPSNTTDLQNNLLFDQKYQIASPISTVFVVAGVQQPSIVLAPEHATTINNLPLLLQTQIEDNGNSVKSNTIIDSVPPPSVMMVNDDDEEDIEGRKNDLSENEVVTSNDDTFQSKSLPFNIMQDDISDVLEILLKNEKWPESPLSETTVSKRNEENHQQPVLQSNVLSSTFNESSLNEPMSPLLSNEISSGKFASSSTSTSNYDKNCNSNFVDCPMDVDDNTNMMIDSSSFSNCKTLLEIKKSPTLNDSSPFINSHNKNDLDAAGSVGVGLKNSLIGNFDNNLFDTFKSNVSSNNNNNQLLNSNTFYNTNSNSEQSKDFKESDRNYMNNMNILNNFEIFSTASSMELELAIPMDFEPYDVYQQDTFFNNINNLQNDRDRFLNNATYFNAENENDLFSEVDSFLESVTTEKV